MAIVPCPDVVSSTQAHGKSENQYAKLYKSLMRRTDLSQSGKLLFSAILSLSQQRGYCYATDAYLAGEIGVSPRQVQRLLCELDALRLAAVTGHTRERHITPLQYRHSDETPPAITDKNVRNQHAKPPNARTKTSAIGAAITDKNGGSFAGLSPFLTQNGAGIIDTGGVPRDNPNSINKKEKEITRAPAAERPTQGAGRPQPTAGVWLAPSLGQDGRGASDAAPATTQGQGRGPAMGVTQGGQEKPQGREGFGGAAPATKEAKPLATPIAGPQPVTPEAPPPPGLYPMPGCPAFAALAPEQQQQWVERARAACAERGVPINNDAMGERVLISYARRLFADREAANGEAANGEAA